VIAPLANLAWWASNAPGHARYGRALRDVRGTQESIFHRYLRDNAQTEFGRRHRFSEIRSVADYQQHVPLSTYDDYAPAIDRIAAGETNVLTREQVQRLVPTGGSTSGAKLIPYTRGLLREFNNGIAPWIFDLYRRDTKLLAGRAYWSITPVAPRESRESRDTKVPIGFDEDSAYVGGWGKASSRPRWRCHRM
jgi:hypothetical protein